MPIARRYDVFTLNLSRGNIAASIEVATEDETINDLAPGDEVRVDFSYNLGRPRLGNVNDVAQGGEALTAGQLRYFLKDFFLAWEGTVEGAAIEAGSGKFPSATFGHDTPNIGSAINPNSRIPNHLDITLPGSETLFGDSTLAQTSSDKGTASYKGWIACDQNWSEDINAPEPIDF